jgi:hypothetical protein
MKARNDKKILDLCDKLVRKEILVLMETHAKRTCGCTTD